MPLLTRDEARAKLGGVSEGHFSKIVAGKVKGNPPIPHVQLGRRQMFREETLDKYISDLEARCSKAH